MIAFLKDQLLRYLDQLAHHTPRLSIILIGMTVVAGCATSQMPPEFSKSIDSVTSVLKSVGTGQPSSNPSVPSNSRPAVDAPKVFAQGTDVSQSRDQKVRRASGREPTVPFLFEAGQKWAGRARCEGKEVELRIEIISASPPAKPAGRVWLESNVDARIEMGPITRPEAIGQVKGIFGVETRAMTLRNPTWTVQPRYSPFSFLNGSLSKDATMYSGKMAVMGCRDFQTSMDSEVSAQLVANGKQDLDELVERNTATNAQIRAKLKAQRESNPNRFRYYSLKSGQELDCVSRREEELADGAMRYYCLTSGSITGPEGQRVWEEVSRKAPASSPDLDEAGIRALLNADQNAQVSQQESRAVSRYPAQVADICLSGNQRACTVLDAHVEFTLLDVAGYSDRTLSKMRSALMTVCKSLTGPQSRPCSGVHAIDFHRAKTLGFNDKSHPRWCLLDQAQYIEFQRCTVTSGGGVLGCAPPESELDSYILRNSCSRPVRFRLNQSFNTNEQVLKPGQSFETGTSERIRWVILDR